MSSRIGCNKKGFYVFMIQIQFPMASFEHHYKCVHDPALLYIVRNWMDIVLSCLSVDLILSCGK